MKRILVVTVLLALVLAVAVPAMAAPRRQIEANVYLRVPSGVALGSYTATLCWTGPFEFAEASGPPPGFVGFANPQGNCVRFNGANPYGAEGAIKLITVKLNRVGRGFPRFSLEFSSAAAAYTFESLLPLPPRSYWVRVR